MHYLKADVLACSKVRTKETILTADDLPRVLWAGCVRQVGPDMTFTGFLRGELLTCVRMG